jgi:hypothetical protein
MYNTIEKNGLRWYYLLNNPSILYPSVSTVIGWYDKLYGRWKNTTAGNMANCGTGIHYQIQKYILDEYGVGNPADCGFPNITIWNMTEKERRDKLNKSMRMWFNFLRDHTDYEPIAQELALFSRGDKNRFAGRIDQYVKLDGKYTLLDIKTGGYWESYDYQTAGYFILLTQLEKVEQVVCLYLDANESRNPSKNYVLHKYSMDEVLDNSIEFMELLENYYKNKVLDIVFGGDE